jgi:hypothetical protein
VRCHGRAKEERELKKKLASIKTLGDSSDEEGGAKDWVAKSRATELKKKEKARLEAELKRRQLEAMDDDAEESDSDDDKKVGGYTAAQLKGLKVKHQAHELMDGETVVLTLEDRGYAHLSPQSPTVLSTRTGWVLSDRAVGGSARAELHSTHVAQLARHINISVRAPHTPCLPGFAAACTRE